MCSGVKSDMCCHLCLFTDSVHGNLATDLVPMCGMRGVSVYWQCFIGMGGFKVPVLTCSYILTPVREHLNGESTALAVTSTALAALCSKCTADTEQYDRHMRKCLI